MGRLRHAVLLVLGTSMGCSSSVPGKSPAPPGAEGALAAAPQTQADPRERKLALAVSELLEDRHLRRQKIDDKVSRATFDKFLDELDPGKMFLLAGDARRLEAHAQRIDDELRAGRFDVGHEGSDLYVRRVKVVEKMVAELLAKPFDSSDEERVETDPEKLELAKTEDELRERWRRRLELEVLERVWLMEERLAAKDKKKEPGQEKDEEEEAAAAQVRGPIPATPEGREAKAREDMARSYAGRFARLAAPGPLDAASNVLNALAAVFDPHTGYLPPAAKANFDIHMSGSLHGIGAMLQEDEHLIRVVEIVPGGASWRQGRLEAGDLILSVAQKGKEPVDVTDMRLDEVVKMIRGPKGSVVVLQVRKASGELETITITRDVVVIEESYARGAVIQANGGKPYGYIYLPSFYGGNGARSAKEDVRQLLEAMQSRKLAGVILDLRANGGGLLGDSVEMTGLLIDKGPVVQTQQSDGTRTRLEDDEKGTAFDGQVVVLVDRFSASASEIVAGALQDYRRAVIVGTGPTHGKGTVQVIADLDRLTGASDLGVLKITVQQFFRVNGASTQWQGVVPDIVLPDPVGHVDSGERSLENSIPWTQIEPLAHQDWPARWKLADLVARSAARVSKNDAFRKVLAQAELMRKRRADTMVPLARAEWQARRKEQRAALEAVAPKLDKGPKRFTVTMIDYDGAKPVAARPGGKTDDRGTRWRDNLAHDPWVEEAVFVLADMSR